MSENAAEIPDDLVARQDSPATDADSEPIAAHGDDLADGTTRGVGPDGTERDQQPNTAGADAPAVGLGGATEGDASHPGYEVDPVVPPGRRSSPQGEDDDTA
jgi:hypothetical protein